MRRSLLLMIACFVALMVGGAAAPLWAQWAAPAPTIDGSIAPGEYGTNNQLNNVGNTGQTWYMTWDMTNLYVAIVNANLSEGAVIYIKANPQRLADLLLEYGRQSERLQLRRRRVFVAAVSRSVRDVLQGRVSRVSQFRWKRKLGRSDGELGLLCEQ